jgi:uncharacterized protein (TIGR03435 family)
MKGVGRIVATFVAAAGMQGQIPSVRPAFDSFEVATIKPTPSDWGKNSYLRMEGVEFVGRNQTVKNLIEAAYNLTPRAISSGPAWIDSDRYDILAKTPGEIRPNLEQQMSMVRTLLADRFKLAFHREQKEFSIYALTVTKNGPKLKEGTDPPDGPRPLIFYLSPKAVMLPGRNARMAELASAFQRGALDRPVVDKTGIAGRFDFNLEWTPEESQFNGAGLRGTAESTQPDLFAAIQQQLGLRLEATRGPIETLVIDQVERPSAN